MTTIYIIFLTTVAAVTAFAAFTVKVYKDALRLNPKARTLEQLETDIATAQATILNLQSQIGQLNNLLLAAQNTIEEAKQERNFLDTYEQDLNTKHKTINDLQDTIKEAAGKVREQFNKLEELNAQVSEKLTEISSLDLRKVGLAQMINMQEAKIASLEHEKSALETQIETMTKKKDNLSAELSSLQESIEKKRIELNQLEADLKAAIEQRDLWKKEGEQLRQSNSVLEAKNKALETQNATLEGLRKGLKDAITIIEQSKDKQEETMWKDLDMKPEFSINLHNSRNKILDKEDSFIDEFKKQLKDNSIVFHERTINAFHTGLKAEDISPLVVLSGISGTGKSLLPKLYAQATGMNFLTVPVQPRWDSPQDMLGFFNYMQDKYKATELSRLLWYTDTYNNEKCLWKQEGDLPMSIVLLDEMNLARVEYYFSDLLSKLEFRRMISDFQKPEERGSAEIEIECGVVGKEKITRRLFVNNNTLFVGTMNEDETTQMLSDKVMDRSNMIRFGKPSELQSAPNIEGFGAYYSKKSGYTSYGDWKQWKTLGRGNTLKEVELKKMVTLLLHCMDQAGRPFAHRVWQSIETYVAMYPRIATNPQAFNNALSDQIEMKILPKLNGVELDNNGNVAQALNRIEDIIEKTNDEQLLNAFRKCKKPENGSFFQWKGVVR